MALVRPGQFARTVELPGQGAIERVVDQGALTRTGDTGYYGHYV